MSVVRHEARRRWSTVLAVVAVLVALPTVVRAWPVPGAAVDAETLRGKILASAGQPYQGYAVSSATLALPPLPRLGDVTALLSGTTRLRAWYAARDRWRVDVLDTGTERGVYRAGADEHLWDYGASQLIRITGEQPVRLPRAADLIPPELARRILAAADRDRVAPLPAQRVAGIAASGLRLSSVDPHTTVGHVDIWADPATGLPLRVQLTGRGGRRPVLDTRFLEVAPGPPAAGVLTAPTPRPGVGFTVTHTPDLLSALERVNLGPLPDRLAGQPRRDEVVRVAAVAVYGTGLARYAVLPVPGRIGREAYGSAERWGRHLELPDGDAVLISTPLLSVLVVKSSGTGRTFLLAGMVDAELLERAGAELAGFRA